MRPFAYAALGLAILVTPIVSQAAEKKITKDESKANTVAIGSQAPDFMITDSDGKLIDLQKLTEKGPVLVRLTCGCSGCDKELAYFQSKHTKARG